MKKKRFTRRSSSDSFQNAKSILEKKRKNKKITFRTKKKKKEYSSQSFFDTDDYIQAHAAHATGQNRAWIESACKREEG